MHCEFNLVRRAVQMSPSDTNRSPVAPRPWPQFWSHPRPGPFTTGHGPPVRAGQGRWRPVVNGSAQSSKACWCRTAISETPLAANEEVCRSPVGWARYAPGQDTCEHAFAGQDDMGECSPEPVHPQLAALRGRIPSRASPSLSFSASRSYRACRSIQNRSEVPEKPGQPPRRIHADAALAVHDLVDLPGRDPDLLRQVVLAHP